MSGYNTYGWYQVGNVSDVYGGATKNLLVGRNGNGEPNGHEDSYWTVLAPLTQASHLGSNDPSYGNSVVPRISPELEFFANSFSTGMAGYDASRAAAEDYLPGATDVMDEKMLELLEMARERIL
jgi:hypothetical protein